jgi:hypothetical protein
MAFLQILLTRRDDAASNVIRTLYVALVMGPFNLLKENLLTRQLHGTDQLIPISAPSVFITFNPTFDAQLSTVLYSSFG